MIGVTSANPASLAASTASAATGGNPVVGVLTAHAPGAIGDGLAGALRRAAGPGGLISGEITQVKPGVSFTLTTPSQAEITLAWPADATPTIGAKATVRVTFDGPQPNVTLVALDGRAVFSRSPVSTTPPATGVPAAAIAALTSTPGTGGLRPSRISFEDETALEEALSQPDDTPSAESDATLFAATLLHPAPVPLGQLPLPVGTRYVATVAAGNDHPAADSAALAELTSDYIRQSTVLAGQIIELDPAGRTLVETLIGVLALTTPPPPSPDQRLKLRILGAAPPKAGAAPPSDTPVPGKRALGLIEELLDELAADEPELADALRTQMAAPAGADLLPFLAVFLGDLDAARQALDSDTRKLITRLLTAGRNGLAARLGAATATIRQASPLLPDGWRLITLPYPPSSGTMPVRLYLHRPPPEQDERQKGRRGRGERVVIELGLASLGTLQFDGLARDRRFDMMLRSESALPTELLLSITEAFATALGSCGFDGAISFGTITRNPFLSPAPGAGGTLAISA